MDDNLARFGGDYRRFFARARQLHRWLPSGLRPRGADWLGTRYSPYLTHREQVVGAMKAALQLSDADADLHWRRWLANHGAFALGIYDYGHLDAAWLRRTVQVENPSALADVVRRGGLVLTYHTHHHNTLGCVFGLSGCELWGLAASSDGSPLYPYIGESIERINQGSAQHFGGGHYLFTDEPRRLVRETCRLLAEGKAIVSLGDFSQGGDTRGKPAGLFHGRRICPPSGAVTLALNAGVAIYAAALYLHEGRLLLSMAEIKQRGDTASVLQAYFDFLAQNVARHPWSWQGWDWFRDLPLAE